MTVTVEMYAPLERNMLRREQVGNSKASFDTYIQTPVPPNTWHPDTIPYYVQTEQGSGITVASTSLDNFANPEFIMPEPGPLMDWTRDQMIGVIATVPSAEPTTGQYQISNESGLGLNQSYFRATIGPDDATVKPSSITNTILFNLAPIQRTPASVDGLWISSVFYYNAAIDNGQGTNGRGYHSAFATDPDRSAVAGGTGNPILNWADPSIYNANWNLLNWPRGSGVPGTKHAGFYWISGAPGEMADSWQTAAQWMHNATMTGQHLIYPEYRQVQQVLAYA